MSMQLESGQTLVQAGIGSALFADWLEGGGVPLLSVQGERVSPSWRDFLAGSDCAEPEARPLALQHEEWLQPWQAAMQADLADDPCREAFRKQVSLAGQGQLELIVTGQQPGFLGGPLYTLYKIATAVAIAQRRTAAGRPAVAVFWSADDDDDLREALHPVGWDPGDGQLVRSEGWARRKHRDSGRQMVGTLAANRWSGQASNLLDRLSSDSDRESLSFSLAGIWAESLKKNWNWTRLTRKALLRAFKGAPLWVVSGRDPLLLGAARQILGEFQLRKEIWAEMVRAKGQELSRSGWHSQIGESSLRRPLFLDRGGSRVPLGPKDEVLPNQVLLPGVMLRSLLQDALLAPAAVVAGPGEIAYLEQLRPLYVDLGVTRPPIFPRLFAGLIPAGFGPEELKLLPGAGQADEVHLAQLGRGAAALAAQEVQRILTQELGVSAGRAEELARRRTNRWLKSLLPMLAREQAQARIQRLNRWPGWVAPLGMRQERVLAWAAACALWEQPLVDAVMAAAEAHLNSGVEGEWREFLITVDDPESD